jgi:hypothetical protein
VNVESLSENTAKEAEVAYWRDKRVYKREQGITPRSILIAHSAAEREINYERDLEEKQEIVGTTDAQEFTEHSDEVERRRYKWNKISRFSSEKEGTMIVRMKRTGNERPTMTLLLDYDIDIDNHNRGTEARRPSCILAISVEADTWGKSCFS